MADPARVVADSFASARQFPNIERVPDLDTITAGSRGTCRPNLGRTYHAVLFVCTVAGVAATPAQMRTAFSKIVFKLEGDAKIDASLSEIESVQALWQSRFNQAQLAAGSAVVYLAQPWNQEISAQDGPAWGCLAGKSRGGVDSFSIEIDFDAASVLSSVEIYAITTKPEPLGLHYCLRRYDTSFAPASGKARFADFELDPRKSILAMHINEPGGIGNTILKVQVRADRMDELEEQPYEAIQAWLRTYGLAQQVGWCHLPFAGRGRPLDGLPLIAQSLELILTVGASPGSYAILCEQLEHN